MHQLRTPKSNVFIGIRHLLFSQPSNCEGQVLMGREAIKAPWLRRAYGLSAILLLAITALAKLIMLSTADSAEYLASPAPVFYEASWRILLYFGLVVEGMIIVPLVAFPNCRMGSWALLWLASAVSIFRFAMNFIGYSGPCNCLGALSSSIGLSDEGVGKIIFGITTYWLVGSLLVLTYSSRLKQSKALATIGVGALGMMHANAQSNGLLIEGYETISIIDNQIESEVGRSNFSLTKVGDSWSIVNSYPDSGVEQCLAYVDGKAYTTTKDLASGAVGAAVLNSLSDLLDSAPEFSRLLYFAFCVSGENQATNTPVPFLDPRHPALYAYTVDVKWTQAKQHNLPAEATFSIVKSRIENVPSEKTEYYFRGNSGAKKNLQSFAKSQTAPARFEVLTWTNAFEGSFPLSATLLHVFHSPERSLNRKQLFWVTNIAALSDAPLLASLPPNTRVQHIVQGTNFIYIANDGKWLNDEEATRLGTVKRSAGRGVANIERRMALARFLMLAVCATPVVAYVIYLRRKRNLNKS